MPTTTVTSQIPEDLNALLTRIAAAEERSKSYYIKKGLELILAQRLEDIEDYEVAVTAYAEHQAGGAETYSLDDVFSDP